MVSSRLPQEEGDKPEKKRFKRYPIGYFHVGIAELRTAEGKLHRLIAIDRASKFAFARLVERANTRGFDGGIGDGTVPGYRVSFPAEPTACQGHTSLPHGEQTPCRKPVPSTGRYKLMAGG